MAPQAALMRKSPALGVEGAKPPVGVQGAKPPERGAGRSARTYRERAMEPIAIIGLGCLFPGADSPTAFWQNLVNGIDSTSEATTAEIGVDPAIFFDPARQRADGYSYGRGGFVRGFQLDPAGLKLPAELLRGLDPLYSWSLYVAQQALKDSGYVGSASLDRCGLVLGNLSFPTRSSHRLLAPLYSGLVADALGELLGGAALSLDSLPPLGDAAPARLNGGISGRPAALVAQALGLGGPRLALDAACASSLYALKLACDYLAAGKADLMLAGAVSCADPLFVLTGFSIFTAYPPQGEGSRPLDRSSRGLTAGEGAGMFALKRYADALRDGDHIHGLVRGVGLSNDGAGKHLLVPNPKGQQLAFERAYAAADLSPHSIAYVECHATGTPVGDIIELNSMERFFGAHGHAPLVGSVKSNFGHLLTAAGMAGMIKVLLSMAHGQIPPTIGVADPLASQGGSIGGAGTVRALTPWPAEAGPRRAAVSAFGFGGTNAHVVLEGIGAPAGRAGGLREGSRGLQAPDLVDLAIIGMDACFGPYQGLAAFERGIYEGEDASGPLPPRRWHALERSPALLGTLGLAGGEAPRGAYLAEFSFDFLRAKVPPNPADQPLPQQLLVLQVADNALRDAGLRPGGHVAVLVAMEAEPAMHQLRGRQDLTWQLPSLLARAGIELSAAEYAQLETALKDALHPRAQVNQYVSFIGNIMACRVAALWDLSGPALTISAEEGAVFRALELAKLLLADSTLEAVVVAAVDLAGSVEGVLLDSMAGLAGHAVGEGAGAVVLRRAADARRANQRAYATIDAVALAALEQPRAQGINAINAAAQALAAANLAPAAIGYLELSSAPLPEHRGERLKTADGSDPSIAHHTELASLSRAYRGVSESLSCAVGTAGASLGHAGVASGMAALVKVALCLSSRYLPALPGGALPDPTVLAGTPFYLPDAPRPWLVKRGELRRAAISGLGRDGCAAHVLLSEPDQPTRSRGAFAQRTRSWLLPLAATSRAELLAQLDQLVLALEGDTSLAELAHRAILAYQGRPAAPYALALVARSGAELLREVGFARTGISEAFDQCRDWETPTGSCFTAQPLGPSAPIAFVYPGAFSAYPGLGRELLQLFPSLHERLAELVSDGPALIGERRLYPRRQHAPAQADHERAKAELRGDPLGMIQTSLAFTLLFTAVLREQFAIRPSAALGYSMGEASMLWAMGAWQASDAALATLRASPLFTERLAGRRMAAREYLGLAANEPGDFWGVYIAKASPAAARAALRDERRAFLTHINTPNEVVISGAPDAVQRIIAELGCEAFRAPFDTVMHCAAMHSEYELLVQLNRLPLAANAPAGVTFYGAANYGPLLLDSELLAQQLARATCQPVDFPRLVGRAYADGARIFIEPGPANACTRWVSAILAGQPHVAIALNRQGSDDAAALLALLAKLVSQRVPLDLSPLLPAAYEGDRETGRQGGGARTLIKTIALGGRPMRAAMLSAANRAMLAPHAAQARARLAPPQPLIQLVKEAPAVPEKSPVTDNRLPAANPIAGHSALLARRHAELLALAKAASAPAGRAGGLREDSRGLQAPDAPFAAPSSDVIWGSAELLEFAGGSIARVFGPEYGPIDGYHRRVRLPIPPYLLVSRVTKLGAERERFEPSTITTEYDIPLDAWYSVDGQVPTAVAIESGQCDLLLISYLGIDFACKGERVYRLLDCTLTFLADLPKAGQTLRYDISINSFARNGGTLLFFFSYECFVGDQMVLKMDGGCAGFFTDDELAHGRGVVDSRDDLDQRRAAVRRSFAAPLSSPRRTLGSAELDLLIAGDLAACFGPAYGQGGRNPSLRLPARQMLMLSRVASIDPQGGDWGLGLLVGEQDLTPQSWFFPCHFQDDQVMAGSLMAEGCSQLLQIYMLALGLQTHTFDARFQPVPGVAQVVRCRGQVTPTTSTLVYRLEVTALGLEPRPFAQANIDVILEGRVVVRFRDLALQLVEKNSRIAPPALVKHPATAKPVRYSAAQIEQFTTGSMAACFGPAFAIYEGRRTPRNPNGDLQLISRVLELNGQQGEISPGANLVAEYDVPANPWSCHKNSYPTTPYSILMEIALQPCGFLTTALGSTLSDPSQEFFFRNLDGSGHLLREVDLRGRRITSRASLLSSTAISGIIIQKFDFGLAVDGADFYVGDAAFGYFSGPVLANQSGLDGGRAKPAWHETTSAAGSTSIELRGGHGLFHAQPGRPHERLAGGQLNFIDRAIVFEQGGQHGAGYIYAEKQVDPASWFFACHFYGDPVMPGSLGVEAISEAMQVYALHCGLGRELRSPHFAPLVGQRTSWKYRGQILPSAGLMRLEVHISRIERRDGQIVLRADASLWRDQLRIYEMRELGLTIVEG